jgi:UDP-N-acetylmuramoylalanine--D-glutamate ligase
LDTTVALEASSSFRGLPHRQQEIGQVDGILLVDDSISTIPEATIAALAVYAGRNITVIVGGYDRGIGYAGLIEKVLDGAANAMICLGDSGERIFAEAQAALSERRTAACAVYRAQSMEDAVLCALRVTPAGGAVLLSPAAPSYGSYRDYIERGRDFAAKVGLATPSGQISYSPPV